jgi:hypothetical protein
MHFVHTHDWIFIVCRDALLCALVHALQSNPRTLCISVASTTRALYFRSLNLSIINRGHKAAKSGSTALASWGLQTTY